jgi:integrase/recombinase XerD
VVLIDLGLRPGELVNLQLQDLDFEGNSLRTEGKTGERLLVFSRNTRKALLSYLRVRRVMLGEESLFVDRRGQPMTDHALRQRLRKLGKRVGLAKCFPYLFRHTSATEHLRAGADLFTLRAFMGHSHLETTKRYIHTNLGDIARMQQKSSPAKKLK